MLFSIGQLVATPGALELLEQNNIHPLDLIQRHINGDWGCVCREDARSNDDAVKHGDRILSSYEVGSGKIWVITEYDRSITTLLLPTEY